MIHSFCNQWLNLREFNGDAFAELYPLYDDLLNRYLPMELRRTNHLIQENLPVSRLIDSDFLSLISDWLSTTASTALLVSRCARYLSGRMCCAAALDDGEYSQGNRGWF